MGGKEASRGFIYQGIASVLTALCDTGMGWDTIYTEFDTPNDKVDIALKRNGLIIKCIQVKSSINLFKKSDVQKWLIDLINDSQSPICEIILMGQYKDNTQSFINSIQKYCENKIDKTVTDSLKGFDTDLLKDRFIEFKNLPSNSEYLGSILRDALHKYTSRYNQDLYITYEQIEFIASSTIFEQMLSSIDLKNEGISREQFDSNIKKCILSLAERYHSERKSIGIKSFSRGAEYLEENTDSYLSLTDWFDDRFLKNDYTWEMVNNSLNSFLTQNIDMKSPYQIYLETHYSIAFSAGRILDSKSGINIFPLQKSLGKGIVLWDNSYIDEEYSQLQITNTINDQDNLDTVLIINITHDIYCDVLEYISSSGISVGEIISCSLPEGATSVENGAHALQCINKICEKLDNRNPAQKQHTLHIFSSAPNGLVFFLGQRSRGFGKCVFYEYDFEKKDTGSYYPTISY